MTISLAISTKYLQNCTNLKHLEQIHAHLITANLIHLDSRLYGRLFTLVAAASSTTAAAICYTTRVFTYLHHPTTFFFNILIKFHSKTPTPLTALSSYTHLRSLSLLPDEYTFPFLLKACTLASAIPQAKSIHGQVVKFNFDSLIYVRNCLIHFYSVCGCLSDARLLFDCCNDLDVVSWNSMISGYARVRDMVMAKKTFDEMPERNVVSWSALISGFVQCGCPKEALSVFSSMQMKQVRPNEVTLVSVLAACGHLGALEQGKWVHGYLKSNGVQLNVFLGTSLIDMYAKCGKLEMALEVFNQMGVRNVLAWTTMLKGLAMHGRGIEALSLFSDMEKEGVVPDDVTFIGVLCACTHSGLIEQGRQIFNAMRVKYGIRPKIEHYGCMVDLLARNGLLDEANELIKAMPMEPDALIWGALIAGCRFHKNVELAEDVRKHLIQLEPTNGGVYVLLSNIYAASGRQTEARMVRDSMDKKGVSKTPGCSVIEIRGTVHQFIVGDKSHSRIIEILSKWEEIDRKLKLEGYVCAKGEVLLDIDEEDKEEALARHSEKLAIAFGLISSEDGDAIRIVKNLRVCSDCHHVTKLISRIYDREIIVRDRTRFHIFKDGLCTCKDYW